MNCRFILSEKVDGSMESRETIKSFLEKKNIDKKLIRADLVHGKNIEIVNEDSNKVISKTDGLITTKDVALAVTVADCLPIYICSSQLIGILHAGWKGIKRGIVEEMISKVKELNEKPANLSVFIGSSIKDCHFEVQKDLVEKFSDYKDCFTVRNNKKFLNLQKVVKLKLKNQNVTNIKVSSRCTFCDPKLFSYRRDGKINKMLAVITK